MSTTFFMTYVPSSLTVQWLTTTSRKEHWLTSTSRKEQDGWCWLRKEQQLQSTANRTALLLVEGSQRFSSLPFYMTFISRIDTSFSLEFFLYIRIYLYIFFTFFLFLASVTWNLRIVWHTKFQLMEIKNVLKFLFTFYFLPTTNLFVL